MRKICRYYLLTVPVKAPPDMQGDWLKYNGVWTANGQRYPNGTKELRDYCHAKGMKFGMWMKPERIGEFYDIFEEHPEWITVKANGETGCLIDFTVPEAAAWVENEIERVITENGLDLFRVDYNITSDELFAISKG